MQESKRRQNSIFQNAITSTQMTHRHKYLKNIFRLNSAEYFISEMNADIHQVPSEKAPFIRRGSPDKIRLRFELSNKSFTVECHTIR